MLTVSSFNAILFSLSPPWFLTSFYWFALTSAQALRCYCDQFNTAGCVRTNSSSSTLGECSATEGQQLCLAAWERSPSGGIIIVQYFCSDIGILRYSCLPDGVQVLGGPQFPIVKVCCETDYCNSPAELQYFVNATVQGTIWCADE